MTAYGGASKRRVDPRGPRGRRRGFARHSVYEAALNQTINFAMFRHEHAGFGIEQLNSQRSFRHRGPGLCVVWPGGVGGICGYISSVQTWLSPGGPPPGGAEAGASSLAKPAN